MPVIEKKGSMSLHAFFYFASIAILHEHLLCMYQDIYTGEWAFDAGLSSGTLDPVCESLVTVPFAHGQLPAGTRCGRHMMAQVVGSLPLRCETQLKTLVFHFSLG